MLLTGCCDITKIRNDLKMRNSSWIVYIFTASIEPKHDSKKANYVTRREKRSLVSIQFIYRLN